LFLLIIYPLPYFFSYNISFNFILLMYREVVFGNFLGLKLFSIFNINMWSPETTGTNGAHLFVFN